MIISMSLLFSAGTFGESLFPLFVIFGIDLGIGKFFYLMFFNVLLYGSHGLYIVIYFYFDKQYNKLFRKYIFRKSETEGKAKSKNEKTPSTKTT